ncbi:MAG: recombinase family protein [Bacteroidales bacterium]|nr:recombinase family protein [Bacteroidales bacterium]
MKYVAYYRISTKEQENSHLGLDAQRETVLQYIRHNGNQVIAEFCETESGKKDERPELIKAITLCKSADATLVIAKLDRLSRNLTFISTLMDNKVRFICCDMPDATELTIHIFASLAQWERKRISERTKEALAAKRLREPNWKPGVSNLTEKDRQKAHEKVRQLARTDKDVLKAWYFIKAKKEEGLSYHKIADQLNKGGYKTRRGGLFGAMQVYNIYQRFINLRSDGTQSI